MQVFCGDEYGADIYVLIIKFIFYYRITQNGSKNEKIPVITIEFDVK